jgi:hypothetical protein
MLLKLKLKWKGYSSPSRLLLQLLSPLLLLLRYANVVVVAPATVNPPNNLNFHLVLTLLLVLVWNSHRPTTAVVPPNMDVIVD